MTNEQQFRNKIRWFTFLFSILVVWVHSVNAELFLGMPPLPRLLKSWSRWWERAWASSRCRDFS